MSNKISGFLKHSALVTTIQLLIGLFFILASVGKIYNPVRFMDTVYAYVLLPIPVVPIFSYTLPWIEFTIGILLIFDIFATSAAILATGSMIMFIGAIFIQMYRGVDIACGCFDFLFPEEEIGWRTMLRDNLMLLMAAYLIFVTKNKIWIWGLWQKIRGKA